MELKRICHGECKKYRVNKPTKKGRYASGQTRCQICDIWIDYRGAHVADGSPATKNSTGWYCNCCNYRLRQNPRNIEYKARLRKLKRKESIEDVDFTYFSKRRARMLQELGRIIIKNEHLDDEKIKGILITYDEIEFEFSTSIDVLINLVRTTDPPNKASMIAEFERIRNIIKRTPTKQDITEHSPLHVVEYEKEFESWEHMLDRMGYDPWYRDEPKFD